MPYYEKIVKAGDTEEHIKYYSNRIGKRGHRKAKQKEADEGQKRRNIKRQENELRWMMNANFHDHDDALVTLSWRERKEQDEMLKDMQQMIRRLRRIYKASGKELKYIYTLEIGPRGSRHVHMMLSNTDMREIAEVWKLGVIDIQPLYSNGQYGKIAAYFMKYSLRTEKTLGVKVGRRFNSSRNMIQPKITVNRVEAKTFRKDPMPKKGFYLDKESVCKGFCEANGKPFLQYTLIKIKAEKRRITARAVEGG